MAKTEAMFVPAGREVREPVVRMDECIISLSESIKYLGVYVDRKVRWLEHIRRVRGRVQDLGGKFFALGRRKCGGSRVVLKAIFERVICPMVLYGSEIWSERANDSRMKRHLRAIERPFLRAITRAYRTAPTAALSLLAGCVPLEVQARSRYESHAAWSWRENERGACAWVMSVNGDWVKGGKGVEGELSSMEMEGVAIREGIKEGVRRRGENNGVRVLTDSKHIVGQIGKTGCRNWIVAQIENEIAERLREGVAVRVEWRDRKTDGIRMADRECRRVMRERGGSGGTIKIEGVGKYGERKWRNDREIEEWQRLWREGETGRWLHRLWDRVNRKGIAVTHELTQIATGHGEFKAYLQRFALGEIESARCECGIGDEDVEHVVLRCALVRRVQARQELERVLGHYPPRLGEVSDEQLSAIVRWAQRLIKE